MSVSKSLPVRPSLESLRKQSKKLARDVAAGDATAIARVRAHLPRVEPPLTQRNAQFVIAREYGYAGWQELTTEVRRRLGTSLDGAAEQAERAIHDNDVERLRQLLTEYPALLSWRGDRAGAGEGLLGFATESYGDSFDAGREERFTRASCAEVLIDSGALVVPAILDGLIVSRARGLLRLFERKGLLPPTLRFLAALGDLDVVRKALDEPGHGLAAISDAFAIACSFEHEDIASLLLDKVVELDPDLRTHVDDGIGRPRFTRYFIDNRPGHTTELGLWKAFVVEQVNRAVYSWRGGETSLKNRRGTSDLAAFVRLLQREPWLLGEALVHVQTEIIQRAALVGRGEFISTLLDLNPAILRCQPPPPSQAIEFAFTYANTDLVPLLARVWPVPDDVPHAAGLGDLAGVKRRLEDGVTDQRVLDLALAWSVINDHFDVAEFLLHHGADINTTWSSHEPASILHELVWHRNYDAMRFLIDHGIDMTIRDYRWNATARGWAQYAADDPDLAEWLDNAERQRTLNS